MNRGQKALAAALALLLGVTGCNSSGLVEVTGRLTHNGRAVPSTRVYFQPDDGSRRSTGLTDDDGNFSLRFSSQQSGVKPGPHTVYVKYEVSADEETHQIQPKADKQLRAVIGRYSDPKNSALHYEVSRNGQHFNIELK